jgi:predicted Zn-dependent peptidase
LSVEQMRRYYRDRYHTGNILLAAAGHLDWDHLIALTERHCGRWPAGKPLRTLTLPEPQRQIRLITRPLAQQHLVQMAAAPSSSHPLRFAAEILSIVVGDDAGSRLYWDLVDPGTAESADLSFNEYEGAGVWSTYLCSTPESATDNLERIAEIFDDVNEHSITAEELERARNKVASRLVLQSERPMGRLSSLGGNWLYRREYRTIEDDLSELRAVTMEDIRKLLDEFPLEQTTTVGIGPLEAL